MNMALLIEVKPNSNIPAFSPGDTVKVSTKVVEGDKERTQVFQGLVVKVKASGGGGNFTVRKVSNGVGVERIFPVVSPTIDKIEILKVGKVRRSKLYYLRGKHGKAARIKEKV